MLPRYQQTNNFFYKFSFLAMPDRLRSDSGVELQNYLLDRSIDTENNYVMLPQMASASNDIELIYKKSHYASFI